MMKPAPVLVARMGLLFLLAFGGGAHVYAAESPLVVRVTTDHAVYRLRQVVRITLTETNTSDQDVPIAIGCQILHGFATHLGVTVWTFRDFRLCATATGMLQAGASRTLGFAFGGRRTRGMRLEAGRYVLHAGVDGVTGTASIRLRRPRVPPQ